MVVKFFHHCPKTLLPKRKMAQAGEGASSFSSVWPFQSLGGGPAPPVIAEYTSGEIFCRVRAKGVHYQSLMGREWIERLACHGFRP